MSGVLAPGFPILRNHDHDAQPVGFMHPDGSFEFAADVRISRDNLFEIFGSAGIRVVEWTEVDGVMMVKRGQVLCFSLNAA